MNANQTLLIGDWILRVHPPVQTPAESSIILLHGWTGDETSMEVFAAQMPRNAWLLLPRGIIKTDSIGYGWTADSQPAVMDVERFIDPAQKILAEIPRWKSTFNLPDTKLGLVGFSQGAALAYTLALMNPDLFVKAACLAGYLPVNAQSLFNQASKNAPEFFIAHGTRDEIVPVEFAHQASANLTGSGIKVVSCEDQVGHKIGARCMKTIKTFFSS